MSISRQNLKYYELYVCIYVSEQFLAPFNINYSVLKTSVKPTQLIIKVLGNTRVCYSTAPGIRLNKCIVAQTENVSWAVVASDHYVRWQMAPKRWTHWGKGGHISCRCARMNRTARRGQRYTSLMPSQLSKTTYEEKFNCILLLMGSQYRVWRESG